MTIQIITVDAESIYLLDDPENMDLGPSSPEYRAKMEAEAPTRYAERMRVAREYDALPIGFGPGERSPF